MLQLYSNFSPMHQSSGALAILVSPADWLYPDSTEFPIHRNTISHSSKIVLTADVLRATRRTAKPDFLTAKGRQKAPIL